MTVKQRLHWFAVMVISIPALPFVIAAAISTLLALGMYYFAQLALMPAFQLYRIVKPRMIEALCYLRNPIITFSDWLYNKADWKGI